MRYLLTALAMMSSLCVTAFQQDPLHITGIRVDGVRFVSEALILKETGLVSGKDYSERQLAMARRALMRLPFILSAEMSLERGETYGTYKLVISIEEVTPLFFRYELNHLKQHSDIKSLRGSGDPDTEDSQGLLSVGGRGHFGKWWSWYIITDLEQRSRELDMAPGKPLDVGLSHRNILDTGLFVNLNMQLRRDRDGNHFDPFLGTDQDYVNERDPSPTLILALPLRNRNHWLSLTTTWFSESFMFSNKFNELADAVDANRFRAHLSWAWDTTDDLVLPRDGARLELGVMAVSATSEFSVGLNPEMGIDELSGAWNYDDVVNRLPEDVQNLVTEENSEDQVKGRNKARGVDAALSASFHHPISPIWGTFAQGFFQDRLSEQGMLIRDAEQRLTRLSIGMLCDLTFLFPRRPFDDVRLTLAGHFSERNDLYLRDRKQAVSLDLAWRQRWGLSRISLRYEDFDSEIHPIAPLLEEEPAKP